MHQKFFNSTVVSTWGRRTAALFMAGLLSALIQGAAAAQGLPVDARIASVHGPVTLLRGGSFPLRRNDPLRPGDTIETIPNGQAVISLSDGSQVTVYPNTRVTLRDYRHATNLRELLSVMSGRIRVRIQHAGKRLNPYRVNSPVASIAVRGTTFIVDVQTSGETYVGVVEGAVEVTSQSNPQQKQLVEPGRSVIVRASGDIGQINTVPGGGVENASIKQFANSDQVMSVANTFEQFVSNSINSSGDSRPYLFSAFADSHFDSLRNPAYATEFTQADGRLFLRPSFSRSDELERFGLGLLGVGNGISQMNASSGGELSAQSTFFTPLAGTKTVIGGGIAASKSRLRAEERTEYPTGLGADAGLEQAIEDARIREADNQAVSLSLVAARPIGQSGKTSLGLGFDYFAWRGHLTGRITFAQGGGFSTGFDQTTRDDSRAQIDRAGLTIGLTHQFSARNKLGVYYRFNATSAGGKAPYLFDDPSIVFTVGIPFQSSTRGSEFGFLHRRALSRRWFYSGSGSFRFETISLDRSEGAERIRSRAGRAALGGGLGFALRPRTVFSFDVSGGASRNRGTNTLDINRPGERLLLMGPIRDSGRFLTLHGGAQTDVGKRLLLSALFVTVRQWESNRVFLTEREDRRSFSRHFSNFGAGWRFNPNLLVQYLYSTDYGRSAPAHSLLLRYNFKPGAND